MDLDQQTKNKLKVLIEDLKGLSEVLGHVSFAKNVMFVLLVITCIIGMMIPLVLLSLLFLGVNYFLLLHEETNLKIQLDDINLIISKKLTEEPDEKRS